MQAPAGRALSSSWGRPGPGPLAVGSRSPPPAWQSLIACHNRLNQYAGGHGQAFWLTRVSLALDPRVPGEPQSDLNSAVRGRLGSRPWTPGTGRSPGQP